MEDEIEKGKKIKNNTTEDVGPPSPKSGRKYGSAGVHGMSWEENQGTVMEVRKCNGGTTRKTTVRNWKVFFRTGKKKKRIGMR